jgi:hypothetical protein|mmetsp:Transcript_25902/g.34668  ORF Transcript_25902/g.34668 Transcript_25902/m.34668 type:complete len:97 (-) Transcript_25902:1639-1929(-)
MQIIGFMQQPPLTDCVTTRANYDDDELISLAFQEFWVLKENIEGSGLTINNAISRNGALYCFCEKHIKNEGDSINRLYDFSYSDPKPGNYHNVSKH